MRDNSYASVCNTFYNLLVGRNFTIKYERFQNFPYSSFLAMTKLPLPSALLIDLDGTLIDSRDAYTDYALESIKKAARHMPVGIATGRFAGDTVFYARKLGLIAPQVVENGARLIDPLSSLTLYETILKREILDYLIDRLSHLGMRFYASLGHSMVSDKKDLADHRVSIVSVCAGSKVSALSLCEMFSRIEGLAAQIAMASTGQWYVMFTDPLSNKGRGAQQFAAEVGVSLEDVMAIGDGPNDLPMFNVVGISVAMGHAPDDVKEGARFITDDMAGDGLAKAVNRFIFG